MQTTHPNPHEAAAQPPRPVQIGPEREQNGYHDSDFYIPVIDLSSGKVNHSHLVHTTRFAGSPRYEGIATPDELDSTERAALEGALWGHCVAIAESREISRIMRPGPLMGEWIPPEGTRVMLREPARNRNRETKECSKCGGSGHWINPRRSTDKRRCFGCDGTGSRSVLAKGMRTIPAGTTGTVSSASERRSRHGTWSYGARARIVTDDGDEFSAPTSALRLAEEPDMTRARQSAERMFARFTNWHCPVTHRCAGALARAS